MKRISYDKINLLYNELSQITQLYFPVKESGAVNFKKYQENEIVDMLYDAFLSEKHSS